MNNSYEEIGHLSVTFPADGCEVGTVCAMTNYSMIHGCNAGEPFLGVVESVYGIQAAVQVSGFVTIHYTGEHPYCGYVKLSADGNGGVKADASGKEYWIVNVDRTKQTLVVKL